MAIESVNPATGQVVETFETMSPPALDRLVEGVHAAFLDWRGVPFGERAKPMRAAARLLRERRDEYARTMAVEMGKPIRQGEAEVEKCAWVCEYYAEHAEAFLAAEPRETDASRELRPLRSARRGAGDHALELPLLAGVPLRRAGADGRQRRRAQARVERAALRARRSRRCSATPASRVICSAPRWSDRRPPVRWSSHPRVVAVTLTGSDRAGSQVGERAGRELKKTVLELGGSDPFIVLEDADLAAAARTAADARLVNGGQSCIAAKRFIVVESVADRFLELFADELRRRRMGDPLRATPTSARWRGTICATSSIARWRSRSRAAPGACSAARSHPGRAPSTRPRCSPRWTRACRPSTRRRSVRSRR